MTAILIVFFKWIFLIVALLLVLGILYEQCSRWLLERKAFTNKTFVDINGVPLHYVKKGTGNCTVVFQSGMGSSHAIWQQVQDSVASQAVTLSYDRNGLMFSASSGKEITNEQVSRELELLLEATHCPKPYILIGHSMAGIYLRPFIEAHGKDIAGVVLVDAAHPKQREIASPELIKALKTPPRWLIDLAVHTGIYRLLFSYIPLSAEIPIEHPLHRIEKDFFYRSYQTTLQELANDQINFSDAAHYPSFGDIPLTVITGSSDIRYAAIKNEQLKNEYRQLINFTQHDLLKLSFNSRQVMAPGSGHLVPVNSSALITATIRDMLAISSR